MLPLFPLHTVLFPGIPVYLHVFEERYRIMMRDLLEGDNEFGVVLIREGREAHGPLADIHEYGCTAKVARLERLEDGRMNLMAVGGSPFRIASTNTDLPYLRGEVHTFELGGAPLSGREAQESILPPLTEYYELSGRRKPLDLMQLPRDARSLAYVAAHVLQIPNSQKIGLYEVTTEHELVETVTAMLKKQVHLTKLLREQGAPAGPQGQSLN